MTTDTKKCAHPACKCHVPVGKDYCSESCKNASDMTEISCNCEHAGCKPL